MDDASDPTLPPSALLAWWVSAWLRGLVDTDSLLDALTAASPVHSVVSAPQSGWKTEGSGLSPLLGLLLRTEAEMVGVALPGPGDLTGLAGPTGFNAAALETGEALVVPLVGLGAVPHRVGSGTTWTLHRVNRRPPADVGEADRTLRAELNHVIDELVELDVVSWSPRTADELIELGHAPDLSAPDGIPAVAVRLASRAVHLRTITAHATNDADGAVSAHEMTRRTTALERLDRAARRALAAACSSDAWPEH